MNTQRAVLGLHLAVAVLVFGIAVLAATSGQTVQFVIFSAIAGMIVLLGRSASRVAANR